MGDETLKKVASCLQKPLKRKEDYCFRLGGEEFGVLYQAESKEQGLKYAETIRESIESLQIAHKYNSASAYVTISLGLVCINSTNDQIDSKTKIYQQADQLLYVAKKSCRNQVCFMINE